MSFTVQVNSSNRGPVGRTATPAELARIEAARHTLRSTARWARFAGIYLPGLLGLVTCVLSFANYPGSGPEKLIASLASLALISAVFCLPLLLSSTGRTISDMRRFEQDAANGFPIVEEFGEVRWGKRGFVATTYRGRLISPLFTKFGAVPAYWHHFDGLAAGGYLFSMLPASRLVLEARPATHDPTASGAESSAELALRSAFGNSSLDAAANRAGRATAAQRGRLLVTHWWALLALPVFGGASGMALSQVIERPGLGGILGVVVCVAALAFFVVQLANAVLDTLDGKLESATGTIRFSYGETEVQGRIGPSEFTTNLTRANVFQSDRSYRVYWFKRSHVAVGADPL